MSHAKQLPNTNVVIIGMGWTGAIVARELIDTGLNIVALERGESRGQNEWGAPRVLDELRYAVRSGMMQNLADETITFRNSPEQTALPMRRHGSFLLGNGVGGAGSHWNGYTFRLLPTDLTLASTLQHRYGNRFQANNLTIQDYGVTYEDLEPHYDRFEYLCGISGQAGNLGGLKTGAGNPFEGARAREYPNPPMETQYSGALFAEAARNRGLHPFAAPSANLSRPYTTPDGLNLAACTYCGHCERFGCYNSSKASPNNTLVPALIGKPNFTLRTNSYVTKIVLAEDGKTAKGVEYYDAIGQLVYQPADLVFLCAYGLHNVRLLLLSGIGKAYDYRDGSGVVGKNYCYQTVNVVRAFFDNKVFNHYAAAGASGMIVDDFNGENFDHSQVDFVGGGYLNCGSTNARPILDHAVPDGTPSWGTEFKRAAHYWYDRNMSVIINGSSMPQQSNYLDLDPTYRDKYGLPLLRMTFDFPKNDLSMSTYMTERAVDVLKTLSPKHISAQSRKGPYDISPYQTTHNTGGAIMGSSPESSVVNPYLQSWDVHNVFVPGASAFPQNAGYNPTGTVAALTYWMMSEVKNRYLNGKAGPLA